MQGILNAMRLQANLAENNKKSTKIGIVTSYNDATYSVKVKLQPMDIETGWLPITSDYVGNGWGIFSPPSIGNMVKVDFQEGSINAGVVSGLFFNNVERPLKCPSGSLWLVHKSGSKLKFNNDGTVELVSAGTLTSTAPQWNHTGNVNVNGNVNIVGNETVTGDITDNTATQARTIANMRTIFNIHTHSDPQGGNVSTPNQGM